MLKHQESHQLTKGNACPTISSLERDSREYLSPSLSSLCDKYQADLNQQVDQHTDYPKYLYRAKRRADFSFKFEYFPTISEDLSRYADQGVRLRPYGNPKAKFVCIYKVEQIQEIRDPYILSRLRFELNPFKGSVNDEAHKIDGIPTETQSLYERNSLHSQYHQDIFDKIPTLTCRKDLSHFISKVQTHHKRLYFNELKPLMNKNPFDPKLYARMLSPGMAHDLQQYVQLQNDPDEFFELMQGLERDIAKTRWHAYHSRSHRLISPSKAAIWVMTSWRDRGGVKRKKPIRCPIGVPLSYMQSLRRRNQPFITQEFAKHAHGSLNHWFQEHIWQRFYARYPEKCALTPSQFFKQLGHLDFAFADALYELHMPNLVNPANTNFWTVLQHYLPLMSPWP
ncbi:MAG: hypothetical protein AAGG51_29645 [Cyanobacteria bacterium P01_G01_bin.54]